MPGTPHFILAIALTTSLCGAAAARRSTHLLDV